ncbi:MAG: hypothetical protein JNK60_17490, partial [Acidobacteria bacterium]|nr:hypothetical protein [Acidobacteriota bacterium]
VARSPSESAAAARELAVPQAETVGQARALLAGAAPVRDRAGEQRLDAHFDRLAERARLASGGSAHRERRAEERALRFERAWAASRERLLAERRLFLSRTPPAHRDTERLGLLHTVESQQSSLSVLQGQLLDVRTKLGAAEVEREAAQREAALLVGRVREGERLAAERPHLTAQLETLSRENEMLVSELARESTSARDSAELLRAAELRIVRAEADSLAAFRKADELTARLAEQSGRQRAEAAALAAEGAALRAERDRLAGELSAMTAEFVRFRNLRVFRLTAPLRAVYKALRRAAGHSS